jgi:cation diffusion facilitator CzcD-associated flavoprotein CzcO
MDFNIEGKNVAIIGTGASAIQAIPAIADKVKSLTVFQRTPAWVPKRRKFEFPTWLQVCLLFTLAIKAGGSNLHIFCSGCLLLSLH